MTIEFRKITGDSKNFSIKKNDLEFFGSFRRKDSSIVKLDMNIKGTLLHNCDGCADEIVLDIDEKLAINISEGISDIEDIDVIEVFDGKINFDEICQSEIEAIKCEYHYCQKCLKNFKE